MTFTIASEVARLAAELDTYRASLLLLESRLGILEHEGADIQRLRTSLRASAEAVGKLLALTQR